MDFKVVSKNNVGIVVLLLLVIAVSQAKLLDFLIDSALGRSFLIIFILYLSYCNKILGVVGVLFIIIMFNGNSYYEGLENIAPNPPDTDPNPPDTIAPAPIMPVPIPIKPPNSKLPRELASLMTNLKVTNLISEAAKLEAEEAKLKVEHAKSKKKMKTDATEGFDILGIENTIKRGKQSNSIPVNNLMKDSDSILPYEGYSFLGSFSPF